MRRRAQWPPILLGTFACSAMLLILTTHFIPQTSSPILEPYAANSTQINVHTAAPCSNRVCTQDERFRLVKSQCDLYPELKETYKEDDEQTYFRLLVDDKHKLLYCALPKAASTTFYNMFYYSYTGKYPDGVHCKSCWEEQGLVFLNRFPKEERDRRLKEYFKIMVVRHPLDRLVSCWNGKFTSPHKHATWRFNGPRMIEMFRKIHDNTTLEKEIRKGASFSEFLQYVNYLEENERDKHNQHWNTHYRLCHPCSINYDLIVKVETMQEDSKTVLQKLGLNHSEFPLINARRTDETEETVTLEKRLTEYTTVPSQHLQKIKKMYAPDLDLFGYEWEEEDLKARCGAHCNQNGCC